MEPLSDQDLKWLTEHLDVFWADAAFEAWLERRRPADGFPAFRSLVQAGCDPHALIERVRDVAVAFADHRHRRSRVDVKTAIAAFEQARSCLSTLSDNDAAVDVGLSGRELADLDHLLGRLVHGLDSAHGLTDGGSDQAADQAKQALVEIVKGTTGKYHDDKASVLVDVAFDLAEDYQLVDPGRLISPWSRSGGSYTVEAHRQWRHRARTKSAAPDGGSPPQPTSDGT